MGICTSKLELVNTITIGFHACIVVYKKFSFVFVLSRVGFGGDLGVCGWQFGVSLAHVWGFIRELVVGALL